jgi:hypothetical protein
MTQIVTPDPANINQGPRGIGARAVGGAYTQDCQQDIIDSDAFQGSPIKLSGTTDNITPNGNIVQPNSLQQHLGGNYLVETAGIDAMTGVAPTVGVDDNLSIAVYSDTANAHTITFVGNVIADGVGGHHIITFAAQKGAGVTLRAWNGTWQLISNTACTIT